MKPSPSMVVALIALFVALSGTAVAAGVVPLAKRALVADNAQKLGGKTPKAIANLARPKVTVKTQSFTLDGGAQRDYTTACDTGQKAISGGYDNPTGTAIAVDNRPSADGAWWSIFLINTDTGTASGTLYAICLN
jgi:hypothetical protein